MSAGRILVLGEAILDLVAAPGRPDLFESATGGSSFNTALALGRLGAPAAFMGALSHHTTGAAFADKLKHAGVDIAVATFDARPMPIALASFDPRAQSTAFAIYLEGTAHDAGADRVADLPPEALHLHAASFRCLTGRAGQQTLDMLRAARGRASASFDPNIRPGLVPKRDVTRQLVEERIALCAIAKASAEDLAWLYPGETQDAIARRWLGLGAQLVVVTRGEAGAAAWTGESFAERPAPATVVIDTIGAGDSFTAGLLAAAYGDGALGPDFSPPDRETLGRWLDFAARVAAATCARRGADPPWTHELA